MDVKGVSTDLGTEDRVNDAACAHVVDLDGAIPAAREDYVLVTRVELDCEDSVCVARVMPWSLLHDVHSLLGLLVIDVELGIGASSREDASVVREIKSVDVVTVLLVEGVCALSREHVPMMNHSVR